MEEDQKSLEEIVLTRLIRLNAKIQGLVGGLIAGSGVFLATNWLVLKGGPIGPEGEVVIGPHLSLLSNFFIGYRVSFVGSLIGLAYGFVIGFIVAYCVAEMYNRIVEVKDRKRNNLII